MGFKVLREYTVRDYIEVPTKGIYKISRLVRPIGETLICLYYKQYPNTIIITKEEFKDFLSSPYARQEWGLEKCADIARKVLND